MFIMGKQLNGPVLKLLKTKRSGLTPEKKNWPGLARAKISIPLSGRARSEISISLLGWTGLGPKFQSLFWAGPGSVQNFFLYIRPGRAEIAVMHAWPGLGLRNPARTDHYSWVTAQSFIKLYNVASPQHKLLLIKPLSKSLNMWRCCFTFSWVNLIDDQPLLHRIALIL